MADVIKVQSTGAAVFCRARTLRMSVPTHKPETFGTRRPYIYYSYVFHIIHEYGAENIPDSRIFTALNTLNQDYRKLNADLVDVIPQFQGIAADCDIEFRLAQKDPDGNCTNGIDRVYSYRTNQGNDRAKVVIWDRRNYLNIWVVKTLADGNVAAYAYLPAGASGLGYKVDGVISRIIL
jgi:hypothetical protein